MYSSSIYLVDLFISQACVSTRCCSNQQSVLQSYRDISELIAAKEASKCFQRVA